VRCAKLLGARCRGGILVVELAEDGRRRPRLRQQGRERVLVGLQSGADRGEAGEEHRVFLRVGVRCGELGAALRLLRLQRGSGRALQTCEPGRGRGGEHLDLALDGGQQAASLVDPVLGSRDLVTRDGVGGDGEVGVLSAAAHRARIAVGEAGGQLGSHAVEPALTQVEQLGSGIEQGLVQAAPARCQLGCPTVVVLGGVDQGQALGGGGDEKFELGDPGCTGGAQVDLFGQAIGLGLGRKHAGLSRRVLALGVGEAGAQQGPPGRPRSRVLLVPGELGHGGVEVAHLLQRGVDLGVIRLREGTRGEGSSGGLDCRSRDLHLVLRAVGGRQVAGHGGGPLSGIQVTGALLVRGGVRRQLLEPGAGPGSALAQGRGGATGRQRLRSGTLSARGSVEGGHRRGHSGVQLTHDLGQQWPHRRVPGQWLIGG
jgi:hypothetical protein